MTTPINKVLTNQIQTLSNEELANVSASLSAILGQGGGSGGEPRASAWRPTVTDEGVLSWTLTTSTTTPTPVNIMGPQGETGPQGPQGPSGTNGKDAPIPEFQINSSNAHWEWKYTDESSWTDLNVVASGAVGPQGIQGPSGAKGDTGAKGADATPLTADTTTIAGGTQVTISYTSGGDPLAQFNVLSGAKGADGQKGQDGAPGIDGISPTFTTSVTSDGQHPQGGTHIVISGAAGESAFNVWNGVDGEGATVDLLEGNGIQITHEAGTTNYTISVSADYATKTYVDTASAEALSQAKSWTNQQYFATSAGLDDDKQFAMTKTGWAEVAVPSVPDITATNGISADGHNIGLTTDVYSAIQEISAANDLVGANGISVVAGANNQVIIAPSGISPAKQYAMTTTGWEEVQAGTSFTGINTVNGISGDGLSTPVGLHTSAVSAISAVKYEEINANMIAQKLLVVTGDGQIISYVQDGKANGEGCLFFVTSAHN